MVVTVITRIKAHYVLMPRSNINSGLYQHMHAFQVQQLNYNHYILGHHNVKVCSCRQADNSNSAARDLFVYTRA